MLEAEFDLAHRSHSTLGRHYPMTDGTCPTCGKPIAEVERADEVTYALHPCGHQFDDRTYEELLARRNDPSGRD